jgi:hypothetical protein
VLVRGGALDGFGPNPSTVRNALMPPRVIYAARSRTVTSP